MELQASMWGPEGGVRYSLRVPSPLRGPGVQGWVAEALRQTAASPFALDTRVLCVRRSCHHPTTHHQGGDGAVELLHGQHQLRSLPLTFFFPPTLITEFPYHQFPASQHLTGKAVATVLAAAIREHPLCPGDSSQNVIFISVS